MQVVTIGLDLAKSVFQVHGVAADGSVAVRRRLRRRDVPGFFAGLPPCLVGIEASRSAHYWARELTALGHTVRLMPPSYVKPYVKRNKNDAADAEAICEAVTRPTMRFVPVKSEQQQAAILLHRVRDLLIRQRTQLVNALRSHLAEFGIVGPQGLWNVKRLVDVVRDGGAPPAAARRALSLLVEQLESLGEQVAAIEKDIQAWHRQHEACRRLAVVPGIGPITASAIVATVPDLTMFSSGRDFAAWLGVTPRQSSSGGKERLGGISKRGDRYLRRLLFSGALAVILRERRKEVPSGWLGQLLGRRPIKVAAVALANKMARVVWAMLARDQTFRTPATI
ncbi:MAG: IS110 family transposase [Xanthobacteraceae bacterium]